MNLGLVQRTFNFARMEDLYFSLNCGLSWSFTVAKRSHPFSYHPSAVYADVM